MRDGHLGASGGAARKGQLGVGEAFRHEGILDTVFVGRVVERARLGSVDGVVPEITGRAWITAYADYVLHDDDPFPEGFTIGDVWPAWYRGRRAAGAGGGGALAVADAVSRAGPGRGPGRARGCTGARWDATRRSCWRSG